MQRYPKKKAGEATILHFKEETLRFACCDCGLVHVHDFEVNGDHLVERCWRDDRATSQLRRRNFGGLQQSGGVGKWRMKRKK